MALRARTVVAFDQGAVSGAVLGRGAASPRVRALRRVPLPAGAIRVGPFDDNVADPDTVREALQRLARELSLNGSGICLVLPDGVGLLSLLDVPSGVAPADFARHRLRNTLPYPADEALVDVLRLGDRRVVAAAVRRQVIQGYERAAADAGLGQERLDLAPLCALAALVREPAPTGTVDLVLGDAAVCLAVPADGTLRAFRSRRRDPSSDEGQRLWEEAMRTASLAGVEACGLRVVGSGALAAVAALRAAGASADTGWKGALDGADGAELSWLAAAV
jgi:hypothetical protein